MKIAIIVNPLIPVPPEQYGGIERIVYMLIQELTKKGHAITLYAHEDSRPNCRLVGYRESAAYGIKDFIRVNSLTAGIALQRFDLVHTFGRMSNIALLMLFGLPKVVSYQLPPTIAQVKKANQIARKNSLYFTACSNHIARQLEGIAHVTTIYNGVGMKDYAFNGQVPPDAPLVFLGRIQQEKGTDIAIQVALKTGRQLIIAGNIPAEPHHRLYFEEQVAPFIDQQQIRYIGPVNNAQKNDLLRNAGAMLMPVTWDEPFGIVMAEALACGTPVIGFNRGAIPEVITDGINGFVCETLEEMIAAVECSGEIDRRNCRAVAEERFSSGVLAGQYQQLYREITARH